MHNVNVTQGNCYSNTKINFKKIPGYTWEKRICGESIIAISIIEYLNVCIIEYFHACVNEVFFTTWPSMGKTIYKTNEQIHLKFIHLTPHNVKISNTNWVEIMYSKEVGGASYIVTFDSTPKQPNTCSLL